MAPEPSQAGVEAIVIGTSAGAVEALSTVLPGLPADYPLPVLVVVHSPPERNSALTHIFQSKCRIQVKEAEDKEPIRPGVVYFAPPDYHLLVEPDLCLSLSSEEPVCFCRPAIDVLFETAAAAFGSGLVGIVLTGANEDGARGLQTVCNSGGRGIVQDPSKSMVSIMPQAAWESCKEARILSLEEIAQLLLTLPDVIARRGSNG